MVTRSHIVLIERGRQTPTARIGSQLSERSDTFTAI
jgi:hypothetical protein